MAKTLEHDVASWTKILESSETIEAIEAISAEPNWKNCKKNHIEAIPEAVKNLLTADQTKRFMKGDAVILEYLPMNKRMKLEAALGVGLLDSEQIVGVNRTLISEVSSDSFFGFFSVPKIKIGEVLSGF